MYNDNDKEDFFESTPQEPAPQKPKEPELKPDDPRYYDKDDEWEHIRPAARSWKMWIGFVACGIILGALYGVYVWFFTPYIEQSVQYGYVEKIERRGHVFKTFEGVFMPYKSLADTIEPYSGDILFSTADDHLAAELRRLQLSNIPARIEYSTYSGTLPWRGDSKVVITAVDTADVSKIYPVPLQHPLIPTPHLEGGHGVEP